ncbi:Serpin-ZX [Camellia lanceoleosa]|uniref:Serpin-ZX n=1 Tax=Camellia lanceoleosa TaxID=1840588 RepID=A0ACC0GBT2_9ERIC|nr:Serpin-ZX [Camellia lanceoleosa]
MNQEFGLRKEDVSKLWIPRFKFSFEFEASETIKQMGLKLPFMNVSELTEMVVGGGVERGGLFLSKVFHKSCIEVNEEGTEAAASTASTYRLVSLRIPTPIFVVDHLFKFMVREETSRAVLFTGVVLNPLLVA